MLHVLAHVHVGAIAASCFEPRWIAYAQERLGRASERALAEDAATLARVLASHDALAAAHAVAWLWDDERAARAALDRDLSELDEGDVADPIALRIARAAGPGAEILRAAAELELGAVAALDGRDAPIDVAPLARALDDIARAAPSLADVRVSLARPLPRRGRALGRSILVGAPGVCGADLESVAWQAAHEATVLEVTGAPRAFAEVEREALALLRARARRAGLAAAHGRWLGTLDLSELGPIPDEGDLSE